MIYRIVMLEEELENTFLYELKGETEKLGEWQIRIDVFENERLLKKKIENETDYSKVTLMTGKQKRDIYLKKELGNEEALNGGKQQNECMYIEVYGHVLEFHMRNGTVKRIRGTLKNCIRQMEGMNYVQVHKSYFVNMIYIDNIELKHIVLKNKERIPLSRHRRIDVKRKFEEYQNC